MTNFIVHHLDKHYLECKGCFERVEIPRRVLNARMPQEAVLCYKQEFAARHIADGCDEAAEVVNNLKCAVSNRIRVSKAYETAQRVLGC